MGLVYNIQHYSLHDGPGIRTTVFLKGCPLDCIWCHNPESKETDPQIILQSDACLGCGNCIETCQKDCRSMGENGKVVYQAEDCRYCLACAEACAYGGIAVVGEVMSTQAVMVEIMKDKPFYEESGGGMTLSGGEPLMQADFTKELLLSAKSLGIHTCVETCGCWDQRVLLDVLSHADMVLYDIKDTNKERLKKYTSSNLDTILDNLYALDKLGVKTQVRCIMVKGVNMEETHYQKLAEIYDRLTNCQSLELLPYHAFGEAKVTRLGGEGQPREDWIPTKEDMERARERIRLAMKTKKAYIVR